MGNRELDKLLKDLLQRFKSEDRLPDWDDFAQQLDPDRQPIHTQDPLDDKNLKEALSNYKPTGEVEGWEKIQASLDAADQEFDQNVHHKIKQFEAPYDPVSWSEFLAKFTNRQLLRTKLVALKVIEFAAVILLMLTVINMDRLGKYPFDTPVEQQQPFVPPSSPHPFDKAYNNNPSSTTGIIASNEVLPLKSNNVTQSNSSSALSNDIKKAEANGITFASSNIRSTSETNISSVTSEAPHTLPMDGAELHYYDEIVPGSLSDKLAISTPEQNLLPVNISMIRDESISTDLKDPSHITASLTSTRSEIAPIVVDAVPHPNYVKPLTKTFVEFGILTQVDYNRLRMPEDRLYSAGKQIVFPQQGIPSYGFGAGFTIALGHPIWAMETGIIYNAKDFKPGRELIVGGAFDNGSVEFEAMRLQMVSLPFQYRYRFLPKGRLKAYGLAGFGLHVIAQSDIEVLIDYNFPSLSFGQNPNTDPDLAETIRETRRIREHIQDGAPFSTKSFFSVHAGLGLEYVAASHKTLFFQAAYQYQVPNVKFSNNNGKHIRSVSLQAGVRTPLGT